MVEPRKRGVGQKLGLSRPQIVAAAMRVLQREGYDALTIRNVASELGVKSASLYWHFATKDELADQLADEILADFDPGEAGKASWQEDLRGGSLRYFQHLMSKRDAGRLRAGRLVTGPHTLRWMERGLSVFRRAGLAPLEVAFASHAVHVYIQGFVIFASSPLSAAEASGVSADAARAAARSVFADLPAETYPNVRALAGPLTEGRGEERFLFGLDCLIAGIAARAGGGGP